MPESQFWKPSNNMNTAAIKPKKNGKALKNLGLSGIVVLIIIGLFGLASFIFVIKPGLALSKQAELLKADTANIQEALLSRDLVAFNDALNNTEAHLNDLRKERDNNFGWAKNFGPTAPYYSDSEHFINAGLHAVAAGKEFAVVIEPFADAVGLKVAPKNSEVTESTDSVELTDAEQASLNEEPEELSLAEAFSTWIGVMPAVADDLDGVIAELTLVGDELEQVDPNRYPEQVRGIYVRDTIEQAQAALSQLNEYAPDLKRALTIVPGILGVDTGEKRYMIIMQNDKELRATGGFWTFISTFKINNALLSSDFTSYNSYYVDDVLNTIDAIHTFPTVPDAYARHLKVERMFARDANVSPDLPTSVDQFMEFWELAQPLAPSQIKSVDGVFTIDTKVLEELLEVTGPVTVNGVTYTHENVVLELERLASLTLREQVNRKQILGDMMEAMLVNVFESNSNLWPKIIEKGVDLAVRKHISGYLFDPEAQALLERYGFANVIVNNVSGDYAYVVQTNLGGDKTNWFVNKEITHTLEQENGRWVRTVKVSYNYPQPSAEYGPFIKRFRDWVRVYVPLGSELIEINGSQDVTGEGEEKDRTYFHGYVEAGPGEAAEITFKYYLPENTIEGNTYNLYIQKQSGIDIETHNVIVNGKSESVEFKLDKQYSTAL
ncbi:MAG: DUF4012 domain-containing protein [Patescibacteria group bacterium]